MTRRLIAEQWDSFEREVLRKDATAIQRQDMRSAFYSGATVLLLALTNGVAGKDVMDGPEVVLRLKAELLAYMNSLKKSASAIR